MKKPLVFLLVLLFVSVTHANTYYSTNNSAPNETSNWHSNRNGSGSSPSKFTYGDIFIIQAGHHLTTTANWVISGSGAKIIIENGAILEANDKVSVPDFQVEGTGTYIHNKDIANFPGSNSISLDAASTVEIRDWASAPLPDDVNWGNLIIDMEGYTSNWNQKGKLTSVAGNLIIRSTGNGNKELRLAAGQEYTLTIGGDLIIEGGILEAASNNKNVDQKIIINGSYSQTGGTFTCSNNKSNLEIDFYGTNSNFSKTGGSLINTYMDFVVNADKKLTINNDLSLASSSSMTVKGTINCGANQIKGSGSFSLTSNGNIITSSSSGVDGVIAVTGSAVYQNGSSYEFLAPTTNPFPVNAATVSATNIVVNADVSLNKDVTITGSLNLLNGNITIPAGNIVTINSGNAITGSGFGVSKHIITKVNSSTGAKGMLRVKNFTGSILLPIGNETYYMPVTLTASGSNDFSVAVFQGATSNGAPDGTPFTQQQKSKMVDAVWIINQNSGSNDVSMQLSWPNALEGTAFQSLSNNQIGIAHYGTYWESPLGSGDQVQNTATRTNITSFSPFGVGQIGTPLPLKFGTIKVYEANTNLNIDWTSYNEINVSHFEIQRSQNGQLFTTIGTLNAKNNDNVATYTWTDTAPFKGTSFYRIKAVDIDGKSTYSTVARIDLSQSTTTLALFPNPVENSRLSIQVSNISKGQYKLAIWNVYGRFVYSQVLNHSGGAISQIIQLPPDVPPGMYSLTITGNGNKLVKQFVVR
jgi:hypothetical protein